MSILGYVKLMTVVLVVLLFIDGFRVADRNRELENQALDLKATREQLTAQVKDLQVALAKAKADAETQAEAAKKGHEAEAEAEQKRIDALNTRIKALEAENKELDKHDGALNSELHDVEEELAKFQTEQEEAFRALTLFLGLPRDGIKSSADLIEKLQGRAKQAKLGRSICTRFAGDYLDRLNVETRCEAEKLKRIESGLDESVRPPTKLDAKPESGPKPEAE